MGRISWNNRDFYAVLCLPETAGAADIQNRWDFLSKVLHPDKGSKEKERHYTQVFQSWSEAYAVLSNSQREYDAQRQALRAASSTNDRQREELQERHRRDMEKLGAVMSEEIARKDARIAALESNAREQRARLGSATGHVYLTTRLSAAQRAAGQTLVLEPGPTELVVPPGAGVGTILRFPAQGRNVSGRRGDLFVEIHDDPAVSPTLLVEEGYQKQRGRTARLLGRALWMVVAGAALLVAGGVLGAAIAGLF